MRHACQSTHVAWNTTGDFAMCGSPRWMRHATLVESSSNQDRCQSEHPSSVGVFSFERVFHVVKPIIHWGTALLGPSAQTHHMGCCALDHTSLGCPDCLHVESGRR